MSKITYSEPADYFPKEIREEFFGIYDEYDPAKIKESTEKEDNKDKSKAKSGKGRKMADIKFEIIEEIGVLSESSKGWRKELNLVSWNGAAAKYDIRDWAPEHEKMGKGITLTKEEAEKLKELL